MIFRANLAYLGALAGLFSLTGCIPAPMGTYYKPYVQSSTAQYSGDLCRGQSGAPSNLAFEIAPGITVNLSTMKLAAEQNRADLPVRVTIELPSNVRFQFLSPAIDFATSQDGSRNKFTAVMQISGAKMIEPNRFIDPAQIVPTTLDASPVADLNFQASISLNGSIQEGFIPKRLTMQFPAIAIAGKESNTLPPLVLRAQAVALPRYQDQTSLVYATKEAMEKDEQAYQSCLIKSNASNCKSMRYFNDASYQYTQGPFTYSGRWYVFNVEKNSGFHWNLKLAYQDPMIWKIVGNQIQFKDEDTSASYVYKLDKVRLAFAYNAPLNSMVRMSSTPSSSSENVRLSFSGSLGKDQLENYYLFFPPFELDGKRMEIKPIKLERRSLDFGILPFNC